MLILHVVCFAPKKHQWLFQAQLLEAANCVGNNNKKHKNVQKVGMEGRHKGEWLFKKKKVSKISNTAYCDLSCLPFSICVSLHILNITSPSFSCCIFGSETGGRNFFFFFLYPVLWFFLFYEACEPES